MLKKAIFSKKTNKKVFLQLNIELMELPKTYRPENIEQKWYDYWLNNGYFHSEPDEREPYVIVIPPPNVTGVLHIGHFLNNTIQDILIRRARMQGYNTCWVPGTDHASIATEAKVANKLAKQGIDKHSLTREQFLEHAWEWTREHGGIILKQLRKLGASCDWERTTFTLDEHYYKSVIKVFVQLYNEGLIYRGLKMINWDPKAKTAISDEEVKYEELPGKLYYVRYPIVGENTYITIATTRPETILADTAICVNPNDPRYKHLHGKKAIVPLVNREVPIITDEYVDMEFGTGALKVTPAHDPNDYELGLKHNLEIIDIFNDDATLNEKAIFFVGQTREQAAKSIVKELDRLGLIEKIEDYKHNVGLSERTNVPIEPRLSVQWFLKMKELVKPALKAVLEGEIRFVPEHFKNTYKYWLENIRDWNISRQLWWGHRIPAYYIKNTDEFVVAETAEEALQLAKKKTGNPNLTLADLEQDPDVLDTWFSSWLWPIAVFNGILEPNNKEINYYYPTSVLVTGHDILFFWVARMIIAGYKFRNKYPFKDVYFTGLIRDSQRRKMSKSLGNSPDILELIEKYGADGMRVGIMLCSPAGGDLIYNDELPIQGRNFVNKIWNAFRLVAGWQVQEAKEQPEYAQKAIEWFENKLNKTIEIVEHQFENYRISEALMTLYRLFWEDFASWYLEIVKPKYGENIDNQTLAKTKEFFEILLRLLHPFIPFITEELWQRIYPRKDRESIVIAPYPQPSSYDEQIITHFENIKKVISNIRKIRKEKKIKQNEALSLKIRIIEGQYNDYFDSVIKKLAFIDKIEKIEQKIANAAVFVVKNVEYYISLNIDIQEEIKKLEKELAYAEGFLNSVLKKLNNPNFVNKAPKNVVDKERQKQRDAQTRIKALKEQIHNLKMQL